MAKIIPITAHFLHFLVKTLKESFWAPARQVAPGAPRGTRLTDPAGFLTLLTTRSGLGACPD